MTVSMLKACAVALMTLVAVWAFASYLQPSFTGARAAALLRCN